MMKKKPIRWAILGPGAIAEHFAGAFPAASGCTLEAVACRHLEKSREFASRHNIPKAYGSSQELFEDPDIDVIYIATPTSAHYENIMDALKAGKHVLCEKTITMNAAQLEECQNLAKEKGLLCIEGLTSHFEPVIPYMKKRIASGEYGSVQFITVTCGSSKPYDPKNRFFSPELGGGAIFDIGCYALGMANYFISSYPNCVASDCIIAGTGVDMKNAWILSNEKGELATVMLSLCSKTQKICIIACEKAFVRIEGFIRGSKAEVVWEDGRKETYEFPVRQLEAEVEALNDCIRSGAADCDLVPMDLSLSILKCMDAARKQWNYSFDFEKEAAV